MNALLVGLFLFTGSGVQSDSVKMDTVTISAKYDIDITEISKMPRFLSGIIGEVAQILGFAPSKLSYLETISSPNGAGNDGFRMELRDQDGKEWIHVISDTAEISFAEPPRSKRDTLKADGIRFVEDLRNFFRKSGPSQLKETFRFGGDTLTFEVHDTTLGWFNPVYQKYGPSRYIFSSKDQRGKSYMRCEFLVGFKDGIVVYPRVDAYLYEKKIGLAIKLQKLEITRK